MFNYSIRGFSLIELLFALTISITGITGLMRYHQTLVFQFSYATEVQHVWQIAHQLLESYPDSVLTLPTHWHYQFSHLSLPYSEPVGTNHLTQCESVNVQVVSARNIHAELERLIC